MKKITFFLIGTITGFVLCFIALYLSGIALEYFSIRLYDSESDQQRNFNIALTLSTILSLISGLFFLKRFT